MSFNPVKVLVAGGEGFIGSRLTKILDTNDRVFYDVVDLKNGQDVCDFDGCKYDVIVLLAASLKHDIEMFKHNLKIYEWAIKQDSHIVFASSAAVYGDTGEIHFEDSLLLAPTLYGKSKLLGESLLAQYCSAFTVLRFANVYGDGDGNGVVDIFLRGGKTIYGDGNDVRDYIHVDDVCFAINRIILNCDRFIGDVFNLSSGIGLSTLQVFEKFGKGVPVFIDERSFDVKFSVLSNAKALHCGLLDGV